MEEPIETFDMEDGRTLKIYADDSAEDPRKHSEPLGTMACMHRRYTLGDVQPKSIEEMHEMIKDAAVCLPIYMYDHSGITIRTSPFSCPWDSGQIGYIFISKEKARKEFGRLTKKTLANITECLIGEIKTYDQYLTGDVYGFVITRNCKCNNCDDNHDKLLDTCWGFYGHDWKENGLFEQAGYSPATNKVV